MKIAITGSTGFVGSSLWNELTNASLHKNLLFKLIRPSQSNPPEKSSLSSIGLIIPSDNSVAERVGDFENELSKLDVIIHAAARVHSMNGEARKTSDEYRKDNVGLTLRLAQYAAKAGVKRFVFLSSIKVNGESTQPDNPFTSGGIFEPTDLYGISKYEAEKGLLDIAKNSDMEVVIIRPPLVYGPGVKANFASLIKLVKKEIPLPLGAVNNKRSLIAIDNLVDFISLCADRERSPQAANQVFVISDDEDVSTTELLRKIAKAYDKKQWLLPVPVKLIMFVAKLLGKSEQADRVLGNLQVDCSKAKSLLGWKPVITMGEQLKKMADAEK